MPWLDRYFRPGYVNASDGTTVYPAESILSLVGAVLSDNAGAGTTNAIVTFQAVQVSNAGTILLSNAQECWTDASRGTCSITPPTVGVGTRFRVLDGKRGGSFSALSCASIANASYTVEDPNNPGQFSTNPILMRNPTGGATWEADPTGSFYKVLQ